MDIEINQQSIYDIVSRSLSIIGKRSVDDQGNRLFEDITLGSNEKAIIEDYVNNAVNALVTELSGFVSNYNSSTSTITVTLPGNHNSDIDTFIEKSFNGYIVAYCLYSWFFITAPKIADKYQGDMAIQLASLVRMLHGKKAPSGDTDIIDAVSTQIEQNT